MTRINLIPAHRRIARSRRRLCRTWITIWSVYLATLLIAHPIAKSGLNIDDTLESKLATERETNSEANRTLEQVQFAHDETRATLQATHMVENQADWSLLLMLLSQEQGNDIVFKECGLKPRVNADILKAKAFNSTDPRQATQGIDASGGSIEHFIVELSGYGMSQRAVSQFVLRLERTNLFDRVTLEESRREGFLADQAIAFRLHCVLSGGKGDAS